MRDDNKPVPIPEGIRDWAATLPPPAADMVAGADITQPHLYLPLGASADQLATVRRQITDWARDIGVSRERTQDIALAVDEAATNAIEHAYPGRQGTFTLFAACDRRSGAMRVIVSDSGAWRPPPREPGLRGRGLKLMGSLSDLFELCHAPHGTTVMLGWRRR
jgi:serine/threonine-protein kinase RsbW